MKSLAPLKPCPNCGNINKARVIFENVPRSINHRAHSRPVVVTKVNCSSCGLFYNGETKEHETVPFRYWVLNLLMAFGLAIFIGIVFLIILAVVVRFFNA